MNAFLRTHSHSFATRAVRLITALALAGCVIPASAGLNWSALRATGATSVLPGDPVSFVFEQSYSFDQISETVPEDPPVELPFWGTAIHHFQGMRTLSESWSSGAEVFVEVHDPLHPGVVLAADQGWMTDGNGSLAFMFSFPNPGIFEVQASGNWSTGFAGEMTRPYVVQYCVAWSCLDIDSGIESTPLWAGGNGGNYPTSSVWITVVPEPETYAMFLVGLGALGVAVKRRKATIGGN